MSSDLHSSQQSDDHAWQEIEATLTEMATIAKSDQPFHQVAGELLERTVRVLAARGGAVWLVGPDQGLRLQHQINLEKLSSVEHGCGDFHRPLLEDVLQAGVAKSFSPRSAASGQTATANPTEFLLIVHPLCLDGEVAGLMEIIQRPTTNAASLRGNQRLIAVAAEHVGDCLKRHRLRQLRESLSRSLEFERFACQIHQSLDVPSTAYAIVNEGRRYVGCDRISVAVRQGRKYRLLAVSGVDTINRRSNAVQRLERLAAAVGRMGETLWYASDATELAPEIQVELDSYVDQSHTRSLGIVPMQPSASESNQGSARNRPIGVLVAEWFEAATDESTRNRVGSVATQGGLALTNALRYRRLPTLPLARVLASASPNQRGKSLAMILAVVLGLGMVAVLALTPADFDISVRGELQPRQRREIFAPLDGQIKDLRVGHNDLVAAGDTLLVLDSTKIDLDIQRVTGERDTTQERLLAIELALLQYTPAAEDQYLDREQLAAEQEELKQQLASQQRQLELLRQERDSLEVRSPLVGRVLTWDAEQLLADRPVQRGQALMTVANLQGPWIAELQIPDDRIGFVFEVHAHQDAPPRVSFELATQRGLVHQGTIESIANRTELTEDQRHIIRAIVQVNDETVGNLRPGATIFAKIHCGQQRLATIWLRDVMDTIREWLWL